MFRGRKYFQFIVRIVAIVVATQLLLPESQAGAPLFFKENQSPTLNVLISESPETASLIHTGYEVAETDLNTDGSPEYVLKSSECQNKRKFCDFFVIALKNDDFLVLAQISGTNIIIDSKKNHGILDILAFNIHKNDYDYTRYVWSPSRMKYVPEGDVG